MYFQKITNLLENTPSQPTIFRTENLIGITNDACGTYIINSQIKFEILIFRQSLCDNSDAYIQISGTVTVAPQARDNSSNVNKEVVFKNYAPFTDCISEKNNTQLDNAKDIDVVMPLYNLIRHSLK